MNDLAARSFEERDREIEQLYLKHELTYKEIAKLFKLTRQRVHQILSRRGVIGRKTGPAIDRVAIVEAAKDGKAQTIREIANVTGHTTKVVSRVLNEEGLLEVVRRRRIPLREDRERLMQEYQRVAEALGRTPSATDLQEHAQYSVYTFVTAFGGMNELQEAAGFEPLGPGDRAKGKMDDEVVP